FRMFYGDTALFGAWHAMESGLAFFGADHILFGTDMPFDPERGPGFVRDTIAAMERMRASTEDKAAIYEGNARRLLKPRVSARGQLAARCPGRSVRIASSTLAPGKSRAT